MRKFLLKLHLYLGLLAGLLLMVIGTTGAMLVFEYDLDHAFRSDLWTVTPEGTPQPIDPLLATVRAAYPDRAFLTVKVDFRSNTTLCDRHGT